MSIGCLSDVQLKTIEKMKNGCILNGDVGSGKSRTAIGYYYKVNGGDFYSENYTYMKNPCDLYIITTASKRDKLEWDEELVLFMLSRTPRVGAPYKNKVVVDSWNNIQKYKNVKDSFFIFDEQRVVGKGLWVTTFLKLVKFNKWILLSATPGDVWMDYLPVFLANGFFKTRSEFYEEHVIFNRFTSYPKVERYINTGILFKYRNEILIDMNVYRTTKQHHIDIAVNYDKERYNDVVKNRWNPYTDAPIETAGEYCLVLRHIVNSDPSRLDAIVKILQDHPKTIIFYSFDYELDLLRSLLTKMNYPFSEWNGHKHQDILTGDKWVYLVQYTAGCEGWNCITTDTMAFYSQNYSYKKIKQACGRTYRMNTPYKDLYYFHLKSNANIDKAISRAIVSKKQFNELKFAPEFGKR